MTCLRLSLNEDYQSIDDLTVDIGLVNFGNCPLMVKQTNKQKKTNKQKPSTLTHFLVSAESGSV